MDEKLIERMKIEEKKTSLLVSYFLLGILLIVFLIEVAVNWSTNAFATNRSNTTSLIISAVFYTFNLIVAKKKWLPRSAKYILSTYNVSIISFTMYQYATIQGWAYGLRTVTLFLYFFPFLVALLYVSPGLCLYTGILTATLYLLLAFYGIYGAQVSLIGHEDFTVENYSWSTLVFLELVFIATGVISAFVAKRFHNILINTFESDVLAAQKKEEMEMRTRFFINLAHEIKTPLTLIDNYFNRYVDQNELPMELDIVNRNIRKMKRDIVYFMDIEKIQRGNVADLGSGASDLSENVEELFTIYKQTYPNRQWSGVVEPNLTAVGEPAFWDRILYNLIDNAVKYSPPNALIRVDASRSKNRISLAVGNEGQGIPSERIPHLFEPYYQLNHSRFSNQGMGMGLSMVKILCDRVGIDIEIHSEPGKWTEAFLSIPSADFPITTEHRDRERRLESVPIQESEFRTDTILPEDSPNLIIIEDHVELRQYLISELSSHYRIREAGNGKEAMDLLAEEGSVDIILSDIMMDGMDGLEFLDNLRSQPSGEFMPLIFLTARTDEETKKMSHELGAVDFIEKPFDIRDLRRKLESSIRLKKTMENQARSRLNKALNEFLGTESQQLVDPIKIFRKRFGLSDREVEVALLIRSGEENKELAEKLYVSINTLKTHIRHIYEKCGVSNRMELVNLINDLHKELSGQ